METKLALNWEQGLAFSADVDGHKVIVDAQHGSEPSLGPSPKKLLMVSLAGCTGMDVVSILNKMRVNFSRFSINVHAELADEHPKKYLRILLEYQLDAAAEDMEKIVKAIELSKDRYCGVWNTLSPGLPIEYKVTLL
ncbi:MAG TPA: OsmC family protein [Bacteroidales bacterium]|nr:OsmC family protein [Bacteroidales bacterium]HOK99178.1 OsmC family protein [Bacteroidales bacterium]HPO65045.1 OsmC family protein [Bacteroidales bacterium]